MRAKVILAGLTAVLTVVGLAVPAAAVTPSAGDYCAANAVQAGSAEVSTMHCFDSFAASISFATNGKVQLTEAQASRPLTQEELAASTVGPNASYVLSVDYLNTNWSGASLTYTAPATCYQHDWQAASMKAPWNNAISSVYNYYDCSTIIFDGVNETGTERPIDSDNEGGRDLGTMNNRASSQCWSDFYGFC